MLQELTPVIRIIDTVLPLAEARKAHELIESGQTCGKVVLRVAE
jgi:NADPH:quinone reductase-like Zn-dependent oxidoreductase